MFATTMKPDTATERTPAMRQSSGTAAVNPNWHTFATLGLENRSEASPPSLVDAALGGIGAGTGALVARIAPLFPPSIARVLEAAAVLRGLQGRMMGACAEICDVGYICIARVPLWLRAVLPSLGAPAWFTDAVWPILAAVGVVVRDALLPVLFELARDFVNPFWGIFTKDLPAIWSGIKRMFAGIQGSDPVEFYLGMNDVQQAVLEAAGRIEWSLSMCLMLIAAAASAASAALGGGASAAASGGTATPAGVAVAGAASASTLGSSAYAVSEVLGLALGAASVTNDIARLSVAVPAYLADDRSEEARRERFDDLIATGFRAGVVMVMIALAFLAVRLRRPAGEIAVRALKEPAVRQAVDELDELVRRLSASEFEWPLSTPAIELHNSTMRVGVDEVLDRFRAGLKIDGTMEYLGSRVHVADDNVFDVFVASELLRANPWMSVREARTRARGVLGLYARQAHRILVRSDISSDKITGIIAHETGHFVFGDWLYKPGLEGLNEALAQTIAKRLVPDSLDGYPELVALLAPVVDHLGFERLVPAAVKNSENAFFDLVDDAFGPGAGVDLVKRLERTYQRDVLRAHTGKMLARLPGRDTISVGSFSRGTYKQWLSVVRQFGVRAPTVGLPNSTRLRSNMRGVRGQAHHIVPGAEPGFEEARGFLALAEIDINDAINGADLPVSVHTRSLHTNPRYRGELTASLGAALKKSLRKGELSAEEYQEEVSKVLSRFAQRLNRGEFTPGIVPPPP